MAIDTNGGESLDSIATVRGFAGGQTLLGRYRLVKSLGHGGMGVVWLANDEKLGRDVALKFLPDLVFNDRASLKGLKQEMLRTLELTHPNIVRTYDFIQESTFAGISMEFVDGDTLRNLQADQPQSVFQVSQLAPWTRQLCEALEYAHGSAGIIHRDLKPANLMVNSRGQVKVADFGIARSLVDATNLISMGLGVSGTLNYMSPQQLSDERERSAADDIYSTGATLYDLLTSRPPFYTGDVTAQIREKIPPSVADRRTSLGIPAGDVPENWERAIADCLAKNPANRPRSAGELATRLGLSTAASTSTVVGMPVPNAAPVQTTQPAPPSATFAPAEAVRGTVSPGTVSPVTVPPPQTTGGAIGAVPLQTAALTGKRTSPWLVFGIAALVALLIAAAAAFYWARQALQAVTETPGASPTPAETAPAQGGMIVATDPPGANVTVGDLPPKKTPAAFSYLPAGSETVQIALDGYEPFSTTANVDAGKINNLGTIPLERVKGPLSITSNPSGLAYVLNSKTDPQLSVTGITPLNTSLMPVGEYNVTVTKPGSPPQQQTVAIAKGQDKQLIFQFAANSPTELIPVGSGPPGAGGSASHLDLTVPQNASSGQPAISGNGSSGSQQATDQGGSGGGAADSGGSGDSGAQQVNYQYFHDQLAPYGTWVNVNGTMYWHPDQAIAADPDWRPYYDMGQWVQTDDGLFWQSDYTWGDIPFHYGRWVLDPTQGWIWAPDYTWGPAWVYWRDAADDGYLGWAPLPYGAVYVDGVLMYNGVVVGPDFDFGLGPDYWAFVDYHHFHEDIFRMRGHEWAYHMDRDHVHGFWTRSHVHSDFAKDSQGRFVNNGLGHQRMAHITHNQLQHFSFEERAPVGDRNKLAEEHRTSHTGGGQGAGGHEGSHHYGSEGGGEGRNSFASLERSSGFGDKSGFGGERSGFREERSGFGGGGAGLYGGGRSSGFDVSKVYRPPSGGMGGMSHESFGGGGGGRGGGRRK